MPKCRNTSRKLKNEIDQEYELVREMRMEEEQQRDKEKFLLPDDEREEIILTLKRSEKLFSNLSVKSHLQKINIIRFKNIRL